MMLMVLYIEGIHLNRSSRNKHVYDHNKMVIDINMCDGPPLYYLHSGIM